MGLISAAYRWNEEIRDQNYKTTRWKDKKYIYQALISLMKGGAVTISMSAFTNALPLGEHSSSAFASNIAKYSEIQYSNVAGKYIRWKPFT